MKFQTVCISYLFKYDQGHKVLLLDHIAKDFDQEVLRSLLFGILEYGILNPHHSSPLSLRHRHEGAPFQPKVLRLASLGIVEWERQKRRQGRMRDGASRAGREVRRHQTVDALFRWVNLGEGVVDLQQGEKVVNLWHGGILQKEIRKEQSSSFGH
ncbi:unnamed protein product [Prunus armeniaca]